MDESIAAYVKFGQHVFGERPVAGDLGKVLFSLSSKPWYSIKRLKQAIQQMVVDVAQLPAESKLLEKKDSQCLTQVTQRFSSMSAARLSLPVHPRFVCATRTKSSKVELLRSYETKAADQQDFDCYIWEAGCATSAAPMFFSSVEFHSSGAEFVDGALRRNNPVREVIAEANRIWKDRKLGCLISLGTGWAQVSEVPKRLDKFLAKAVKMMTDADEIAESFAKDQLGRDLVSSNRYYRFSVEQGMEGLKLDDWKETERMDALTMAYLGKPEKAEAMVRSARSLLHPDLNSRWEITCGWKNIN